MVSIILQGERDLFLKNFYPKSRLNAIARQDRDKHHIIRHSKKIPFVYDQQDKDRHNYMLEGNSKRKTRSFITKLKKPLSSEIRRKQYVKSKFPSLVSQKLKPLHGIYSHNKFQCISKIKHNLYPFVIEEIIDEETDEGENREKDVYIWRKTPDPSKKYLKSLFFEYK